jgi:hypothetical protein
MNRVFCNPETSRHFRGVAALLESYAESAVQRSNLDEILARRLLSWSHVDWSIESDACFMMFLIDASSRKTRSRSGEDQFTFVSIRMTSV